MHFISINVLLAQDQKEGGNLNFLMKVISYSFLPHPRDHAARLETERETLGLGREMSRGERENLQVGLQASQSRNGCEQTIIFLDLQSIETVDLYTLPPS